MTNMLLSSLCDIGNRLFLIRKKQGLTQAEVAELSGLSERTYAEIERGVVNMRIKSLLQICEALHVTPNEILTGEPEEKFLPLEETFARLTACQPKDRETALRLLSVYLQSLS